MEDLGIEELVHDELCGTIALGNAEEILEKDKEEPRQIFPCPVDTLPEEDQRALEEKIPIRSPKALEEALEDYLS